MGLKLTTSDYESNTLPIAQSYCLFLFVLLLLLSLMMINGT